MLDPTTNEVYLIDFGTASILPDGVILPSNEFYYWRNPFAFAPESYLDQPVSFNADVFSFAVWFSKIFRDDDKTVFDRVTDVENVWAEGFDKASQIAREISEREPSLPRLDRFGPKFEQLLADMLIWDPAKRPQSAEVAERAKLLK